MQFDCFSFWFCSDVIKTNLQRPVDVSSTSSSLRRLAATSSSSSSSLFSVGRSIVRQHGVLGLWRGAGATLWRVAPGGGLYFVTLHHLRSVALAINRSSSSSSSSNKTNGGGSSLVSSQNFVIGGLARGLAALVLHPFSVVKTRQESHDARFASYPKSTLSTLAHMYRFVVVTGLCPAKAFVLYFSSWHLCFFLAFDLSLIRFEGWRAWYSGLLPTLARDVPFSSIYVMSYEYFKSSLQQPNPLVGPLSGVPVRFLFCFSR